MASIDRVAVALLLSVLAITGGPTGVASDDGRPVGDGRIADSVRENGSVRAAGDWWDTDWKYRRNFTIRERSGQDLTRYPVVTPPIDIGSASVESIRVVNQQTGAVVPFGVKETAEGYRLAFKINVSANGELDTFAVYYGNPDAESVALKWEEARNNFYDGFEDGTFDWTVESGEWRESGGTVEMSGDGVRAHHNLSHPLAQSELP
ncbi:MAG: hypothetical protein ABEI99_00030, partial [Halobaculum sp.]